MSSGQTQDQLEPAHAWKVVQDIRGKISWSEKMLSRFRAKKLPAAESSPQGWARHWRFWKRRATRGTCERGSTTWVRLPGGSQPARQEKRLTAGRIVHGSSDDLRFATAEALAYLTWLVRFTDAELRDIKEQPGLSHGRRQGRVVEKDAARER